MNITKSWLPSISAFRFLSLLTFTLVFLSNQNVYSADVTFAWDKNIEEDLDGYRIYYKTCSSCDWTSGTGASEGDSPINIPLEVLDDPEHPEYTIHNLNDDTTYFFAATAYDIDGNESGHSDQVFYEPQENLLLEIGEVSVDHNWKWVAFSETFLNPIVVAKSLSCNQDDPAVVRICDVGATGFEIRIQEWDYLDGIHAEETVGYIVMERGTHTLPDGTMVEAERFETDRTGFFGNVTFSQSFQVAPVVITAVSSDNEADAVTTRMRNVSTNGFEVRMQEQELNSQTHNTETISYIAWEPSSGTVAGMTFEVEKTNDVMTHYFQTIVYNETFTDIPVFIADIQTTDGGDTANVRWQDKDFYGVDVKIAEEQSRDSETYHTTEVVGYMLFLRTLSLMDTDGDGIPDYDEASIYNTDPNSADTDGDGINDGSELAFWGADWDVDYDSDGLINILDADSDNDGFSDGVEIDSGFDPADPDSRPQPPFLEIGEVSVDHNWKWVAFSETFLDPIVVAKSLSCNQDDPAVVRVRDVGATGFEIRIQEWDYLDGIHAEETVGYIVMERGTHTLPDGTMVEAERFETDRTGFFGNVTFSQGFQVAPVLIAAVCSYNGVDTVTTRVQNISTNGFELRMQEQELNSQTHNTETISYIAWEPSSGTVAGMTFEVEKTNDVMQHYFQTIVYNETFTDIPVFIADIQTTDGRDTANVRWQDKDFYGVDVKIAEEQSRDSETYHTTEVVGYMLFSLIH